MSTMRILTVLIAAALASQGLSRRSNTLQSFSRCHSIGRGGITPRDPRKSPFPRPNAYQGRGDAPTPGYDAGVQQIGSVGIGEDGSTRVTADLSSRDSRIGFIRKVYGILGAQMVVTLGMIYFSVTNREAMLHFMPTPAGGIAGVLSFISVLVVPVLLHLRPSLQHERPTSFGLLTLFTLAESYLVSMISLAYNPRSVLFAVLQTAVITVGLSLFALKPRPQWDMDSMGSYLFSGLLGLLTFGIGKWLFGFHDLSFLYSMFGAMVFSFYIVYDTQRIASGDHPGHSFNRNQYVLAAMVVYVDIISLFLKLLAASQKEEK